MQTSPMLPSPKTMSVLSPTLQLSNSVSDQERASNALNLLRNSGALTPKMDSPRLSVQSYNSPVPTPGKLSMTPSKSVMLSPLPLPTPSVENVTPIPLSVSPSKYKLPQVQSGDRIVKNGVGTPVIVPPMTPVASLEREVKVPAEFTPLRSPEQAVRLSNVRAVPEQKMEYTTYPVAENSSIEDFLLDRGYIQEGSITIEGPGGGKVLYIKACDPMGNKVLIDPDLHGRLSVGLSDRTTVKVAEGIKVPSQLKITVEECAENPSCGVGFVCDDEFCVLRNDMNGEVKQETYVVSSSPVQKTVTSTGSALATPVITLSAIQNNPIETIAYTIKASDSIKAAAEQNSKMELEFIRQMAAGLAMRIAEVQGAYSDMLSFRRAEEQKARQIAVEHRRLKKSGMSTADNAAKLKMVNDKLKELNETEENLLDHIRTLVIENKEPLDVLNQRTRDAQSALFLQARKSFDPVLSASIRDPKQWGFPAQLADESYGELLSGNWSTKVPSNENTKSLYRVAQSVPM